MHSLATFSPPNYLHSKSGQGVVAKTKLDQVCNTKTISVCTGSIESLKNEIPSALEDFAHKLAILGSTDQLGAVYLVIPYATFSDEMRLHRMCICHTPAGYDDKEGLHPETVVAIAQVVIELDTDCAKNLQSCVEGLVYSPIWHCGHSEELQACFTDREVLPELVPVLQQLELDTTIKVKEKLCEAILSYSFTF